MANKLKPPEAVEALLRNPSAVLTFYEELRGAREDAILHSEAFEGIVHVIERLGSFLCNEVGNLGMYEEYLLETARLSALAEVPNGRAVHTPFPLLYKLVKDARNDAVHQGAFARHLTTHAIELALVLEDALRHSPNLPLVRDYMAPHPLCAEDWHPISFIRHQMLANDFSFLPVERNGNWFLVSDFDVAIFLGRDTRERKKLLPQKLIDTNIQLQSAAFCHVAMPLDEALLMLKGDRRPVLVLHEEQGQQPKTLAGIVTPFDLL